MGVTSPSAREAISSHIASLGPGGSPERGANARKTVRWTVFSEHGPIGPGMLSAKLTEGLSSGRLSFVVAVTLF